MEQGFLKKIIIVILLAIAFNVTFYMDTHNGQFPWNSSKKEEFYTKNVESQNYVSKRASNAYYKSNKSYNNTRSFHKYEQELPSHIRYNHNLGSIFYNNWFEYKKNIDFGEIIEPTVIKLVILRDGRILSADISKSSGSVKIDKKVLAFVKSLAPFPPFPKDFERDRLNIILNISRIQFSTRYF